MGAAKAAFNGSKYAYGLAGRLGVLPNSESPAAEMVTVGATVVVVVSPTMVDVVVVEVATVVDVVVAPGTVVEVEEVKDENVGTVDVGDPG